MVVDTQVIRNGLVRIICANGYSVSVGFGRGHYCDDDSFEVAILDPNDNWATRRLMGNDDDDVIGYVPSAQLLEIVGAVASW